jgi:hypothetical protein
LKTKVNYKHLIGTGLILMALLSANAGQAKEENGKETPNEPFELICGYSAKTLIDVGTEDAKVATKLWTDMIARKKGGKPLEGYSRWQ